jgi:NAD(P)-dependent dehydrogenase (short-subunit alcohol dehydrogenase family)
VIIQRRQEVLDSAKKAINAKYADTKITTYAASVTDYDRITEIVKEVGKLDVVVANAAAGHDMVPVKDIPVADITRVFATNVTAPMHIFDQFLALPSPGPRTAIYVSSAAGQFTQPSNSVYGASKAAANFLIQHLASEHAGTDFTFQTFHPGLIYTELVAALMPKSAFEWENRKSARSEFCEY